MSARLKSWLYDAVWAFDWSAHWLTVAGRVLWHMPIVKCPACGGDGGAVEGYYEPEWCECRFCWDRASEWFGDWDNLGWFVGRLHPLRFPVVLFRWKTGHWTVRGWLACKAGRHRFGEYNLCERCGEHAGGSR